MAFKGPDNSFARTLQEPRPCTHTCLISAHIALECLICDTWSVRHEGVRGGDERMTSTYSVGVQAASAFCNGNNPPLLSLEEHDNTKLHL